GDVPVHPQDLVVAWPILYCLECVVVQIGAGRIARVREREEIQERLRGWINPALRDLVVGETRRSAAGAVAGAGERRVADENQLPSAVKRLREVARALELRRHPPLVEATGIRARQDVLRPEEEQLVASVVELRLGQQHRPAEGPRGVVERIQRWIALCAVQTALLTTLELVPVPGIVTLVERSGAVEILGPTPRE